MPDTGRLGVNRNCKCKTAVANEHTRNFRCPNENTGILMIEELGEHQWQVEGLNYRDILFASPLYRINLLLELSVVLGSKELKSYHGRKLRIIPS